VIRCGLFIGSGAYESAEPRACGRNSRCNRVPRRGGDRCAVPLTVNGKLDTRALPRTEYQQVDHYPPRPVNPTEDIRRHLRHVLGLERVGVDDSPSSNSAGQLLSNAGGGASRAAGVLCRAAYVFVEQTVPAAQLAKEPHLPRRSGR